MKLINIVTLTFTLCLFLTACSYEPTSPLQQDVSSGNMEKIPEVVEQNIEGNTSVNLYTLNFGNWSNVVSHPFNTVANFSIESLAQGLTELTGLAFTINGATVEGSTAIVDWSVESTLIAGLGNIQQKDEFFMYDNVSLNWFMMDSLYLSIINNFSVTEVYYTMSNGQPLNLTDMGLDSIFPLETPYFGSPYYIGEGDYFTVMEINKAIYNTAGVWHINGDEAAARIEFNGMGNYTAFYADENIESSGYMSAVDFLGDGLYSFNLVDDNNEYFTTITFIDEITLKTDIHTYVKTHAYQVG